MSRFKWTKMWTRLAVISALFVICLISVKPASAATTIPIKLNFQGRLTDNNGNAVADGSYNMKFTFYDALTSGTNRWQEYRQQTNRVVVTSGLFSIQLGDVTALSTTLFTTYPDLWLEVELPTPATATCSTLNCASFTEGPLSPRQKLAATAHAFNADTVDGIDGASLAVKGSDNNFSASQTITGTLTATTLSAGTLQTASGDLSINPTGNTVIVGSSTTGSNAALNVTNSSAGSLFYVRNDGYIGIGTTTLGAKLTISGNLATTSNDYSAYYSSGDTYGYSRTVSVSDTEGRYEIGAYDATGTAGGRTLSLNPLGGNVGIGSTTANYLLDVNGDINLAVGATLRFGGTGVCTSSGCTGGGGGSYVNLQGTTPGTPQTGNLNINGTAKVGSLSISGTTDSTIAVSTPTSSGGGQTLNILASDANTNGLGGAINIQGGNGVGTNQVGGAVILNGGNGTGTGGSAGVILAGTYVGEKVQGVMVGFQNGGTSGKLKVASSTAGQNLLTITDTTTTAADVFTIADEGAVTIQNKTDSASAFLIKSTLDQQIFKVNTSNASIGVSTGFFAPTTDQLSISNPVASTTANVNNLALNFKGGTAAVEGGGLRIDFQPGTTSGGTWNGARIVANATGPVSGVEANGLKIEGPSSQGVGTETGLKITSGWDIGVDIGSGGLQLSTQTDPATPAANTLRTYAKNINGRAFLHQKGSSGISTPFQPALFQNSINYITPGTGTSGNSIGGNPTFNNAATGVTTNADQTYGLYTNVVSGAVAGNTAGVGTTLAQFFRGSASGSNGFFSVQRWSFPDANYGAGATGARMFVGLVNGTMASSVAADDPGANHAGFSYSTNRGDAAWQFSTKNTGTQSIGTTSMAFAVANVYDFYVFTPPQGTTIYWRIDNLTAGTTQEGSTTAQLPAAASGMRAGGSIATLTTVARNMRMGKIYVETDR